MADQQSSDAALIPNEEYEAQFYGFLPSSLVQGIVRIIEDRTAIAVDEVEENMSQIPESILSRAELQSGMDKFRNKIVLNSEKTLTKLQNHLTGEVLRLPDHLLLPCDLDQRQPSDLVHVQQMGDCIADLHTQYSNELYMQAALRAELQEGEKVLAQQNRVLSELLTPNVTDTCTSLKENLKFVKENRHRQVQAMSEFERRVAAASDALCDGVVAGVPTEEEALLGRLLR